MRSKKRKIRQQNIHEAMAALPIEDEDMHHDLNGISNVITPIGKNTNSRYHRNRLHERVLEKECDNEVSQITDCSNLKSTISDANERKQRIIALCKKVMMRLIDVSSPPDENKKVLLHKLVINEEVTKEIIELAVEMSSSVEDTKHMLMNNCL